MAITSDAIVVLLDVGISMGKKVHEMQKSIEFVSKLVQQRIALNKNDEIGLVLFGTLETKNDLAEDTQYKHISVSRNIKPPDASLLRLITQIKSETAKGDFIDALVVGMDLMSKRVGDKKNVNKRIFLVTDAENKTDISEIDTITVHIIRMDLKINIIGVGFTEEIPPDTILTTKLENELFLKNFCEHIQGAVINLDQSLDLVTFVSPPFIRAKTTYRGFLEVTPLISIPIWSYIKTTEEKLPKKTNISLLSMETDHTETAQVTIQRTLVCKDDPDVEIDKNSVVKGFKYGRTLVPFSKNDEKVLQYRTDPCLKVIGFTPADSVPRHHYLGNSEIVVPLPDDEIAAKATSAIIHALAETSFVAIVRFVKQANYAMQIGVLTPNIKENMECFYYNRLPFAEDIRQYPFAPLVGDNARFKPSNDQLKSAEELIESMDLVSSDPEDPSNNIEELKPSHVYNPSVQYFYQVMHHRVIDPGTSLPPMSDKFSSQIAIPASILEKSAPALENFREHFRLEKNTAIKDKENRRKGWSSGYLDGQLQFDLDNPNNNPDDDALLSFVNQPLSLEEIIRGGVNEVGTVSPVLDFEAMFKRRDVDLIDKAISDMQSVIMKLITESVKQSFYKKALECIVALRKGCIKEEESEKFNQFLTQLKKQCLVKNRDFWDLLVNNQISIIIKDESDDSTAKVEESKLFLLSDQLPIKPVILKTSTDDIMQNESGDDDIDHDAASLFDFIE